MCRLWCLPAAVLLFVSSSPTSAQPEVIGAAAAPQATLPGVITAEGANDAVYEGAPLPPALSNLTVKVQVLLDQAGASPGVIDGIAGHNVQKALSAFEEMNGLPADGLLDADVWTRLAASFEPVLIEYTVTSEDLAGPFLGEVPTDFGAMAALDRLGYANPAEMFAERFHMDIDLLIALNDGMEALIPGSVITVADVGESVATAVVRLEVDGTLGQLRGYDAQDHLVVVYPATVGSTQLPSPSGQHTITAVAFDAAYYYTPDNFQQGNNLGPLTLPPGPNNPIGTTWIDLSEPTYGIHGTPEPARVDKNFSHGCVRLTNWDVEELAGLVQPGVVVEFQ